MIELSVEEIQRRLFTAQADLPDGVERIPLKEVHINKCPVVVPIGTLTDSAADEWGIDVAQAEQHLDMIRQAGLDTKIRQVYTGQEFGPITDPDQALYGGGFFSDSDRRLIEQVHNSQPTDLVTANFSFEDSRLPEMLFRYRARNWPESLSQQERQRWDEFRVQRISSQELGGITLQEYRATISRMMVDPAMGEKERRVLSDLADWPEVIAV
jgi:exodeoxyribonuclease-1